MEFITLNNGIKCPAVGRGIKESGIAREDIFLSTKLWPSEYENENAVDETLERLGVDYVDLLYIHQPAGNWMSGYRLLEKAYREASERVEDSPAVYPGGGASVLYTEGPILRWHTQMGFVVIPGSRNVDHIRDNLVEI